MKTNTLHIIKSAALALAFSGAMSASTIESFSSYTDGSPLAGNPGWSESEPSASDSPLSWVGTLNGSQAGAIGGYYNVPSDSSYSVSLASANALDTATVSVDFALVDYTDYAFRDQFSFSVLGAGGSPLATIYLTPLASGFSGQDTYGWNLTYELAGGSLVDTALKLQAGNLYSLSLEFNADSFVVTLGNEINSYSFTSGSVTYDVSTDSIGGVSFGYSKLADNADFGDGFLVFDNIAVSTAAVPEPATASMLAAFAAGCVVVIRRRKVRA
jgi:hypothetical protein